MTDEELKLRVLALRAQGRSGKEIARALRVRPATVAALVRTIARREVVAAPEPAVVGCWVSPGWRAGLTVEGHPDWPDEEGADSGAAGLVAVLVAREHRYGKVTVCGYLVDVYCLGVKDVVGPRAMHERELSGFVERYYEGYPSPPLAAPIDLARHLAWGAVEYARTLGFEPAHGFNATAAHLGPLTESSAIRFGRDGRPLYVQGPHDDAARILQTLEDSVGQGGFEFVAHSVRESRPAAVPPARRTLRAGGRRASGDVVQEGRAWRTGNR